MDGPLDTTLYDTARHQPSWWEATAGPARDRPPLEGDLRVEVAVIGGGVTGLACARALAARGIGAAVLEAGAIGWGSSGRAGGIVGHGGTKLSHGALVSRFGAAETDRADAMLADAIRTLRAEAEADGVPVQGAGELLLAHSARTARALVAETPPAGFAAEPVAPHGSGIARFGGIRLAPCFGVHPLRLVRAAADRAEAAGARLFPRSEVTLWERAGNAHRLVTAGGAVTADRVVLATNAFAPERLHPAFAARTVPVISNIAVTRPLTGAERAAHPWLGADPASDTRNLLAYLRLLPDGRLLLGMRGDARGTEAGAARMRAATERRIAAAFPGLGGIATEAFWRGPVCATTALRPAIGRLADAPTVFHAFGWHGSGLGLGTLGGRLVAGLIAGEPEDGIPAPWRGLPRRVPLPGLRPLWVSLAMRAYALADRLS